MRKILFILLYTTLFLPIPWAEETFTIEYKPGDKFKITEVSDIRRRLNGKYAGFTYRQIRGVLDVLPGGKEKQIIRGDFYVFQETKKNTRLVANRVDELVSTEFSINDAGEYSVSDKFVYPLSRNFPVFPEKALKPGDSWRAFGIRYVDPLNEGDFTRVQFYCEYTYKGESLYKGNKFHLVTARYALRYKGDDPAGSPKLKSIKNGGHDATIYFDLETRRPVFMKDMIIERLGGEVYTFSDNSQLVLKGFTQTWYDSIKQMDKDDLIEEIKKNIDNTDKTNKENIIVRENDRGILLSLPEVRFYPDSAQFLPEEKGRLNLIADALKQIPRRTFLITGHTADVGSPESQYKLSVERAKAAADYLASRGIPENRFLYEGKGGTLPVASNETDEGRAQNRRVEITILED